jgi:WD40 repeat protein
MNLQEDFQLGPGRVLDAVWLPDGNVALVFSTGVSVYDPDTGSVIKSVGPENKAVGSNVMSPSGKYVATPIYSSNKILVWDANTGKIAYELEARCQAQWFSYQMVAFNSGGSQLAACDGEGISLWDLSSGKKINTFKMERKDYLSIAFNPKNNTLATSGYGNGFTDTVIWDLESGEVIEKLPQIPSYSFNLRFNHEGNILAWGNPDNPFKGPKITFYDINTNQWQTIYPGGVTVFEFSPNDKTLTFSGLRDGTRLLDINTGKYITEPNSEAARLIKYSPDGKRFVAGWIQFSVFRNVGSAGVKQLGDFFQYNQIAFDPNGKYIAAGWDTVALWDLQTKKQALDHISASGNNFLFTPNGDGLVTNAGNKNIEQWSFQSNDPLPFEGPITTNSNAQYNPPLFSPSGDLLAIGVFSWPNDYIRFWDANSKQLLFDIKHSDIRDYEFSPNGKIFASAEKKTIYFWDLRTQKPSKQFNCYKEVHDIAFSPDGALIAAAEANGIQIWDTNSGELVYEFNKVKFKEFFQDIKGTSAIRQVVFSPQGNILASIGYDDDGHKILFAWDIANDKPLYKIIGDIDDNAHRQYLHFAYAGHTGLLFSPGGSFIVTSGLKRSNGEHVQFWDTSSGQLIKTLEYTLGFDIRFPYARRFGFSPDGRLFAVADGAVHILRIADSSDSGQADILLPTRTPPPALPTSTLRPTNTSAPTVAVESIFPNFQVVETDTFDNSNSPKWELDPSAAKIKDGALEIKGMAWKGISRSLREGDGVIVNFKFTQDAWFVIVLKSGAWKTDSWREYSVVLSGGKLVDVITTRGSDETKKRLGGNLDLISGNWYSMLMIIEKNGETLIRVWDPANPLKTIEYKSILGSDWVGIPYKFGAGGETGTIWFDDFKEVKSTSK